MRWMPLGPLAAPAVRLALACCVMVGGTLAVAPQAWAARSQRLTLKKAVRSTPATERVPAAIPPGSIDYSSAGKPPNPRWQEEVARRRRLLPAAAAPADLPIRSADWHSKAPVEISGNPLVLRAVVRLPARPGKWPLALILHGNHGACRDSRGIDHCPVPPAQTCAPGESPVPTPLGMTWLAEELARQGVAAAVVDAGPMVCASGPQAVFSRTELGLAHLQAWRSAQAGGAVGIDSALAAAVDLQKLVLIGHSVGGDAALEMAAQLKAGKGTAHGLPPARGALLIAPPDWLRSAAVSTHLGVVLPTCDADVHTQAGREVWSRALMAGSKYRLGLWQLVGGHHNAANIVWPAEAEDSGKDVCLPSAHVPASDQRLWLGQLAAAFALSSATGQAWPRWMYGQAASPVREGGPALVSATWPEVRSLVVEPGYQLVRSVELVAQRADALVNCATRACVTAGSASELPGWRVSWSKPGMRLDLRWTGAGPGPGQRAVLRLASLAGSPRHRALILQAYWLVGSRRIAAGPVEILPPLDHAGSYTPDALPVVVRLGVEIPLPAGVDLRQARALQLEAPEEERGTLRIGELLWTAAPQKTAGR